MTQLKDIETIKENVPHRFENLLIDSFTPDSDVSGSGDFTIHITKEDPLNRQLFSELDSSESRHMVSTSLVEMMALGSILNTGKIPKGHFAFFAAISKFNKEGSFKVDIPIQGSCKHLSEKAGFHRYEATLTQENAIATSQLMAFFTDGEIEKNDSTLKIKELPHLSLSSPIRTPNYKDPSLFCSNAVNASSTINHCMIPIIIGFPGKCPFTQGWSTGYV